MLRFRNLIALAAVVALPSTAVLAAKKSEAKSDDEAKAKPELDRGGQSGTGENLLEEGQKNLETIQKLLDDVQNDLSGSNTGAGTQAKQQKAMKEMESLIKKLSDACKNCQGGGGGGGGGKKQQQAQKKPGQKKGQGQKQRQNQNQLKSQKQQLADQKKQQQQKGQKNPKNGQDDKGKQRTEEGKSPDSGKAELVDRLRRFERWGLLPEKMHDQMISASSKEPPREYRDIIERYYKRISDFYTKKSR
ncbi:MAG: hypothetical protein AAF517_00065 [Planctomycetota bacterium]